MPTIKEHSRPGLKQALCSFESFPIAKLAIMHPVFRWLMGILIFVATCPAIAAGSHPLCVEGAPEPVDPHFASQLRPTRTATCAYDFSELVARITKLSFDKHDPDSVETAERAFAMPEMTTSYDDPRRASYSMILSGKDGWKLSVWVRESFYPLDKGRAGFVPGLRPKRLFKIKDADLRIDLAVVGSLSAPFVPCIPVSPFFDASLREGWQDIEMKVSPPTDGGLRTPLFQEGSKRVSIDGQRGQCAQHIALMQPAVR